MLQPRLSLLHGISFDTEGEIFGLSQTVITLGQLALQHGAELNTDVIEHILFEGNADHFLKIRSVRCHIHEGQLKANGAIEEIQEAAPFLKDRGLVLLLGKLIIDILKLDGFRVIVVRHAADAVRKHSLEGNAVLCSLRDIRISRISFLDLTKLLLLFLGKALGHAKLRLLLFLSEQPENGIQNLSHDCKQYVLPPSPPDTVASRQRSNCWSCRA